MKPRHIYLGLALLLVCTSLVCSQESNSAPPAAKAESPLKPIRRLGTETFRINSAITGFVLAENRGSVLVTTNTDTKLREIDLRTGAVTELLDLQKQLLPDATRRTRNLYYYEPDQQLIMVHSTGVLRADLKQKALIEEGPTASFKSIVGNSAGKRLLVLDNRRNMQVVKLPTLEVLAEDSQTRNVPYVACHPLEPMFCTVQFTGNKIKFRQYNYETKAESIHEINQDEGMSGLFYTPDGKSIAILHSTNKLTMYDSANWKQLQEIALPGNSYNRNLQFLNNCKQLLVTDYTGEVQLVTIGSTDSPTRIGQFDNGCAPQLTKDEQQLIGTLQGNLLLFRAQAGNYVSPDNFGHRAAVTSLITTPDGTKLISSSMDGKLCAWNLKQDTPPVSYSDNKSYRYSEILGLVNQGQQVLWRVGINRLKLLNAQTLDPDQVTEYNPGYSIARVTISDDQRRLYFSNNSTGTISGWASQPFDPQAKIELHTWPDLSFSSRSLYDFGIAGQQLVASIKPNILTNSYELCLLDSLSGRIKQKFSSAPVTNSGPNTSVTSLSSTSAAFFVDREALLAEVRASVQLHIWDTYSGQLIWNEPRTTTRTTSSSEIVVGTTSVSRTSATVLNPQLITITKDSRFWVWSHGTDLLVLDLYQGKIIHQQTGLTEPIRSLTWVNEESFQLASGHENGMISIWDLSTIIKQQPAITPLTATDWETSWNKLQSGNGLEALQTRWRWRVSKTDGDKELATRLQVTDFDHSIPEKVSDLVASLDQAEFANREQATQQLHALGESIAPYVQEKLNLSKSSEVRYRLRTLLNQWKIKNIERTPAIVQQLRGISIAQYLSTAEAVKILQRIAAGDPLAETTRAAKNAVQK